MALSDDQRAMLRLLAQREQGYEDMAALMGVSVEELRGRVKDALSQLESEGETPPALPDPPSPEPKPDAAKPRPSTPSPAAIPAPPGSPGDSEPPDLSASPPSGQVPPSLPPQPGKSGISLSSKGARVAIAAVAGAVVIVVVLLLVLGGGDSGSSSSTTGSETGTTTTAEAKGGGHPVQEAEEIAANPQGGKETTKALLASVGGGGGKGIAIFGRVKNKLALQVVAEGLEPLAKDEAYAVWIAESPQKMLPLVASPVSEEGVIAAQFEVPNELLGFLANETFDEVAITRTETAKLDAALKQATKGRKAPEYTGTPIMRGTITGPIVGAAQELEAREEAGGKEAGGG